MRKLSLKSFLEWVILLPLNVAFVVALLGGPASLIAKLEAAAQSIPSFGSSGGAGGLTDWQQGIGINFRATSGFVTDGTRQLYGLPYADVYPVERTPTGATTVVTLGRSSGTFGQADRSNSVDVRLAGIGSRNNTGAQARFRIDLPAAGNYEFRIAAGDTGAAHGYQRWVLYDTDGTTALATCIDTDGVAQDNYNDATCTNRSEANWPSANAAATVTVSAGSPPHVFLEMGSLASQAAASTVAHVFLKQL